MATNDFNEQAEQNVQTTQQRHGFVTFWFWFCIISNVISIFLNFVTYQGMKSYDVPGMNIHILIIQIIGVLAGVALIVCYSMLLNWKKNGFWGVVIVAVAACVANVIMIGLLKQDFQSMGLIINLKPTTQILSTVVSIALLWAILQINKNGVRCWDQLD